MYPKQVIVLKGNHEQWLIDFLFQRICSLECYVSPSIITLQDFLTNDEFLSIYLDSRKKSNSQTELIEVLKEKCRLLIRKKHLKLIQWLKNLPSYYETDNQIFVHAGIYEDGLIKERWKIDSTDSDYLFKFPVTKGYFYKMIIAGHIGTFSITNGETYEICQYGSHIYLDSTVCASEKLNLLKYDEYNQIYTGITKEQDEWIEYKIEDRLEIG